MTRLSVEVAFGYSITDSSPEWSNITRYVDIQGGLTINRGASDELSETQAGTCTLTLDNSDGRFSPGLASSPYYPNVKKNVPIRIRTITTAKNLITNPSFESGLSDWSQTVSPTVVQNNGHVQHGSQAMRVTWGAPTGQAVFTVLYGLDIGETYTASAYVWVPVSAPSVEIHIDGMAAGTPSSTTGAFQRLTYTFVATATAHTLVVEVVGTPTPGTQVWIDAVQVEEGSTATTFDSDGAQVHPRFYGMVNEWPIRWEGLESKVSITCTDLFKWLGNQPELSSMLVQEVLLDDPIVYYPLSEPSDATSAGDLVGTGSVGTLAVTQVGSGGTIEFGAGEGPTGAAPVFTPSSASVGKYLSADLGPNFVDANVSFRVRAECWFSTSTTNRVLLGLTSTDAASRLVILLESGTGKIAIEKEQAGFGVTTTVFGTPNLADGALHYLCYVEVANELTIDGTTYTVSSTNAIDLRMLTVGGFANNRLWAGTIAHLAIYLRSVTTAELTPHRTTGTTGHVGEDADDRLSRLASYVGLTVSTSGSTFDGMASQAMLGRPPLEHLREVERTESGRLLASRSEAELVFQSRDVRYNQPAAVSIEYADLDTGGVEMADDDQRMVNTVVASRPGGATQRVVDQTARDLYGPKQQDLELFKDSDLSVTDAANWIVSRYADPPPELRSVPLEASTLDLADYRALLDADVSTVFEVTDMPDEAPSSTQTVTIEGYAETITQAQHKFALHTSRALTDTVWVLDSSSYSQLDSTTRLAY
ncbi:carbohydrate binding domain-containing protein [Streptomyces sp. NPDC006208]|uniref:carbohydrate binding domain-containing protein n=1 Tax=Streptomyces sp. NPDC006208 TaxID=3156734 RepID=UPI0033B23341